jgi:DNA-binding GntR family transcriptional regulator
VTDSPPETPLLASQPLPRFLQISEMLGREILAGHWRAGERIPTEPVLAASLGVAVGTLRKAVAELEQRGMLERRQGSGTYVRARAGRVKNIYEFFRLELLQGGGLPTAQILSVDAAPLPAALLAQDPPSWRQGWRIRRLRALNGTPVALEEIWIDQRHALTPALSDALYQFYKEQLGFWIARVQDQLSVDALPDWAPQALGLAPGTACSYIERQAWSNKDVVEELSRTWVHPQRARYCARWP